MSDPIDARKHPRLSPLIIRTLYRCNEGSGEGYLLNLSAGGAFLATNETLPIDGKVLLTISLPWQLGAIHVESRVVWSSDRIFDTDREMPPGAGLEFGSMSPEDRRKLEGYMEKFNRLAGQIAE